MSDLSSSLRPAPAALAPRRRSRRRASAAPSPRALVLGALLASMAMLGCGDAGPGAADLDEAQLRPLFEAYLPALGRAYGERAPSLIEPYAVPKEVARIDILIDGLAERGQVYKPELRSVTFEKINSWNYANAYATTREVWDVRSFTLDGEQLVNESLGQESLVTYQLKRKDDGWVVLYREVLETSDS